MECEGITPLTGALDAARSFAGRSVRRAILSCVVVITALTALSPCARSQDTDGLAIIQGTPQTGATTRSLPELFSVQTKGNQTSGIPITFTVNSNAGAGGTFPGNANSIVVNTDPSGYAVPPLVVANSTPGTFTVTASDPTGGTVTFNITTRQCVGTPQVSSNSSDPAAAGSLPFEVANACAGSTITFASGVTSTISVANRMRIDDNLTIQGPGAGNLAVDGGNATRLFYVGGGNVNINGLTLKNGLGDGGPHSCGGGAAGMGGALFVYNGSVGLADTELVNNRAQGGSASTQFSNLSSGGAGFGGKAPPGGAGGNGGDLGGFGGNPGLVAGGSGKPGGDGAGGGGYAINTVSNAAVPVAGGPGGFGGGGGASFFPGNKAGTGGFGGGGGAGADGGANAAGGWGGGDGALFGSPFPSPAGGGGAGFGGAVFLRNGSLALYGDTFTNNSAVGGTGGTDGQGKGGSLFILNNMTSSAANSNVAVDFGSTYTGSTAAAAGAGGSGSSDPTLTNYVLGQPCPGADTAAICGLVNEGTLQATAGTPQTVTVGSALSPLQATVQLPSSVPSKFLANVPITFTAPTTGASATFAGNVTTATVKTDANGVATAPQLTANNTSGAYNVNASVGSLQVQFAITNNAQLSQTITFNNPGNQVVGTTLTLIATASSGLTVSFSSLTTSVCTVTGTTANFAMPGTCTIQASQPGNATYAAATPILQSFTVLPAADFNISASPGSATISIAKTASFTLTLSPLNGFTGTVSLACNGGPPASTCTVSPSSVTLQGTSSATAKVTISFRRNSDSKGTFNFTLIATSGALSHQTQVTVTVTD
jgi:hypothetical protein